MDAVPILSADSEDAVLPLGVPVTEQLKESEWPEIDNPYIAVALMTLGVRWTYRVIHEVINGHSHADRYAFRFAPVTKIRTREGVTVWNTLQLLHYFRSGELEKIDPEHPFLYVLRGFANLEKVREMTETATRMISYRSSLEAGMTALIQEGHPAALDKLCMLFGRSGKYSHLKRPV